MESARRAEMGLPLDDWDRAERERAMAQSRAGWDADAWQRAWEQGQAMSLEEAVAYALTDGG